MLRRKIEQLLMDWKNICAPVNSLYKKRVFLQPFKCCKNTRHGAGMGT